jgi:ComF family protein
MPPVHGIVRFAGAIADFVFPRLCPHCGERALDGKPVPATSLPHASQETMPVCRRCLETLGPLDPPVCMLCGAPRALQADGRCPHCPTPPVHFASARAATAFRDCARTLVERLKYQARDHYAEFLASRMVRVCGADWPDWHPDLVVPVPLFHARERERGFNQARLLASFIAPLVRAIPSPDRLLRRTRPTPSQTTVGKKERAENVRGAFEAEALTGLRGARILLVDDVFTTGATLNECSRALAETGTAEIRCLAFARTLLQT